MDLNLSDEQRMMRETVRRFLERELLGRGEMFPNRILQKMGEVGILGGPIPIDYKGCGYDFVSYALFLEEIGRVSSPLRSAVSVQISLVALTLLKWGTEVQKTLYLPRLCSGSSMGCFCLTEPEAGSDVASISTFAERKDTVWSLSGIKTFITNNQTRTVTKIH